MNNKKTEEKVKLFLQSGLCRNATKELGLALSNRWESAWIGVLRLAGGPPGVRIRVSFAAVPARQTRAVADGSGRSGLPGRPSGPKLMSFKSIRTAGAMGFVAPAAVSLESFSAVLKWLLDTPDLLCVGCGVASKRGVRDHPKRELDTPKRGTL